VATGQGFEKLAADLVRIATKATNQQVRRKVLEEGAKPIVERAQRTMQRYRRTGRLDKSIHSSYNTRDETQDIGWSNRGFYGRFYENGYRPVTGKFVRKMGRRRMVNKRPTGRFIKRPHIRPAYVAERENVARRMIETFKNEMRE